MMVSNMYIYIERERIIYYIYAIYIYVLSDVAILGNETLWLPSYVTQRSFKKATSFFGRTIWTKNFKVCLLKEKAVSWEALKKDEVILFSN